MWHSSRGKLKPAFKHPSLPNARGEADQPSCIVLVPIYLLLDSHSLMRDSHWERESGKLTSSHPETSSSSRLTSSPNLAGRVCSRFSPLQITCKHKHNEHIRNVYDWCMSMFKLGFYFVVKFFAQKIQFSSDDHIGVKQQQILAQFLTSFRQYATKAGEEREQSYVQPRTQAVSPTNGLGTRLVEASCWTCIST